MGSLPLAPPGKPWHAALTAKHDLSSAIRFSLRLENPLYFLGHRIPMCTGLYLWPSHPSQIQSDFIFRNQSCPCLCFSSVSQPCPTLCNPMDCSMPGFSVLTNSWSLLKLMSIELVMPSNHRILCHSLLLLPSISPITRVFSKESVLHVRRLKYWSISFSISPSNDYSGLISFRIDW